MKNVADECAFLLVMGKAHLQGRIIIIMSDLVEFL